MQAGEEWINVLVINSGWVQTELGQVVAEGLGFEIAPFERFYLNHWMFALGELH
jgi:hypothetical protein